MGFGVGEYIFTDEFTHKKLNEMHRSFCTHRIHEVGIFSIFIYMNG